MSYRVIKRYGHDNGWSCTFRQYKAVDSHCRFVHGYALAFEFTFECRTLDARDWCYDFGGLKPLKAWLQETFDHKMLLAMDDPQASYFLKGHGLEVIDVIWVKAVGCESFAELAYDRADLILKESGNHPRVRLVSVKVSEHDGNSCIYTREA